MQMLLKKQRTLEERALSDLKGWFLGRANAGQDLLAAAELADLGFSVFVAQTYRREKIGGRAQTVSSLRLRPYVFIEMTIASGFPGITDRTREEAGIAANARGMAHLLCNESGLPRRLHGGVVDTLKRLEIEEMRDAQRATARRTSPFPPGIDVRIVRGLFEGHSGQLLACSRGIAYIVTETATLSVADCDIATLDRQMAKGAG